MSTRKNKKSGNKPNIRKSRKQVRKEERKNKKVRRHEYYSNRNKPGEFVLLKNKNDGLGNTKQDLEHDKLTQKKKIQHSKLGFENKKPQSQVLSTEQIRAREKKQQMKLQQQMNKERKKQLLAANIEEDRNIKHLEKQLKLNKRKSKTIPASFARDGLDFLLEVCEPADDEEIRKYEDSGESEMEEESTMKATKRKSKDERTDSKKIRKEASDFVSDEAVEDQNEDSDSDENGEDFTDELNDALEDSASDENNDFEEGQNDGIEESDNDENIEDQIDHHQDENWTDIYGRKRSKDGSVIIEKTDKYVPPAARAQADSMDAARVQKLEKLKKQLKGLFNRLAESNMHSIATQIEELYMGNSRNDMNSTITNLVTDALVSNVLAPERLLMEHVLLIVILHANVGTEVGAHFLQTIVNQFNDYLTETAVENKKLDNLIIILAQLYNFKMFDSKLIYEVIEKLSEIFEEKHVECILHILKNIGFSLRKDNPLALKDLILSLQKKAANSSDDLKENPRVKFMLDVLLAIKNNNVTKIPNYDTSYSEHLKKIMKGFIRKGNYVTQLNISLEDLLKAEEKGKWWVIGSAWTGNTSEDNKRKHPSETSNTFSQKLLELASKQRMNTDTRKNIFCILMSAEDYLEAFEKLLRLSLKNQQEREIIHVILHCCLQEKSYNPYYATLAQKFCDHDRKYQMTIKYSIWDKLKALKGHSTSQISHLAKLLSHLFLEKCLPISTLKIVQFSELDKVTLRFIKQILLEILLHEDLEVCKGVFEKVGQSDKLKMFRESLRLFLHHFLLRNLESQGIAEEKKGLLRQRVKIIEKMLTGR